MYSVRGVLSFALLHLWTLLGWVFGTFWTDHHNELVLKVAPQRTPFCLEPNTSFSFCANKTKPTVRNIQFTPPYPLHCMLQRADRGANKPCYDIIARLWGISFHFIPWLMMPPADYIKNPKRLMCQRSPEEERNQACRSVKGMPLTPLLLINLFQMLLTKTKKICVVLILPCWYLFHPKKDKDIMVITHVLTCSHVPKQEPGVFRARYFYYFLANFKCTHFFLVQINLL